VRPVPEICHVFICVESGAPEARRLEKAGLRESFRRSHPGQGTANLCYCFEDAYLELLWEADAGEIASPAIARTRLAERARWQRTGASPFGIALRIAPADPLPFESWDYRPPYLPAGLAIPVAVDSDDPRQPFLFRSIGSTRPDAWTDGRAGNRQRAAGLAGLAGLHLDMPADAAPGPALRALAAAGVLTLGTLAGEPRMVLTLARSGGGAARRLSLPEFRWLD
jgi:hypothetical protein